MRKVSAGLMLALMASAWFAFSGCEAPPPSAAVTAESQPAPEDDNPKTEEVLRRMADYLAGLPAFSCKIDSVISIQAQGIDNRTETTKLAMRLERPNRLALIADEDPMGVTFVSDGEQFIQYMPSLKRYTVSDAAADFSGVIDSSGAIGMMSLSRFLIPTSGDEFFQLLTEGVTKSEYLGEEKIGDVMCHRCRFSRESISWDIWIEAGDRPLVHKVVPDMSKQFAESGGMMKDVKFEWTVVFSDWNTAPKFTDADFAFTPPDDAEKVENLLAGLAGEEEAAPHALLGQPAPTFETVDLNEQAIDLSAHLGKNVIMLDFWATWCAPCVAALPSVRDVANEFADRGLVFYAVNSGEDVETIKEFLETEKLEIPVAMDPEGTIGSLFQVEGIPQTVLIGKDGKVQVVHVGYSPAMGDLLTKEVEDLLAGKDLASDAQAKAAETREKREARKTGKGIETEGLSSDAVTDEEAKANESENVTAPAGGDDDNAGSDQAPAVGEPEDSAVSTE